MIAQFIQPSARARIEKSLETLVIIAALITVPLTVLQLRGVAGPYITALDWIIWSVFTVDYLIMIVISQDRLAYAKRNWLFAAVIVLSFPLAPTLLAFARLARLTRLARLIRLLAVSSRGLGALKIVLGRKGLVYVAAVAAFVIFAGGGLLTVLEPDVTEEHFGNGLWWAVVTTTTVGYGDIAPETGGGRLIAVVLMCVGIGLIATLAASIAAYFVESGDTPETHAELADVREQLARIETMLAELRAESGRQEVTPDGHDDWSERCDRQMN